MKLEKRVKNLILFIEYMKFSIYYIFLSVTCLFSKTDSLQWNNAKPDTKSLSYLLRDIESNKIDKIYISNDLTHVYYKENPTDDSDTLDFTSQYKRTITSPAVIPKVLESSEKGKVESFIMEYNPEQGFQIAPIIDNFFIGSVLFFILRGISMALFSRGIPSNNGMMPPNPFSSFLKNTNSDDIKLNIEKSNITLASWAGSPEVSEECFEIISYMRNSTQYKLAGAELPRGILLEGPPGTGKTLIAKAIASETNATFISVSASEFVELFVGMGAAKVRGLFKTARENSPSIIFIDEIDSVGKARGGSSFGGNDEREQTLNQILAEMDGFDSNEDILVIAATNRKDILDAALLRPGRFDRIIYVPLPDKESRKAILQIYLNKKQTSKEPNELIDMDILAEMTQGFSGAQIKNLVNEAAIYSAREGRVIITKPDIEAALEKLVVGIIKKSDTRNLDTRRRIAIHELGHAFIVHFFQQYFQLSKVTIQSTYSGAGGYTLFKESPTIEGLYTKDVLIKRLMVALGGKAAEFIFYGEDFISLGAIQDLKEANSLAKQMITKYGMGNELEVFYDIKQESSMPFSNQQYSDNRLQQIDNESLLLLNEAYSKTLDLLRKERKNIEKVLDILLKRDSLTDSEFRSIIINSNNMNIMNIMNKSQ
jgi:cell division protease FtsH